VFELPFSSSTKWQLSITKDLEKSKDPNNSKYVVMVKGAPERILEMCTTFQDRNGQMSEVDNDFRKQFNQAYETFGNQGKRVIGYCETYFEAPSNIKFTNEEPTNFPKEKMCFIGFAGILDPPKDGVTEAVAKCKSAGVKVFMVTGDHYLTAIAIGK
jgi:sodium/potassium-transporting ATPase subunit alpha